MRLAKVGRVPRPRTSPRRRRKPRRPYAGVMRGASAFCYHLMLRPGCNPPAFLTLCPTGPGMGAPGPQMAGQVRHRTVTAGGGQDRALALGWRLATQPT